MIVVEVKLFLRFFWVVVGFWGGGFCGLCFMLVVYVLFLVILEGVVML